MFEFILAVLAMQNAKVILVGERQVAVSHGTNPKLGRLDNQVIRLWWDVAGTTQSILIDEGGLGAVRYQADTGYYTLYDIDGATVILKLTVGGVPQVPPENLQNKPVFLVVQEGGSSSELYLYTYETFDAAHAFKANAWETASYRTSPVLEAPASLVDHPDFHSVTEALLKGVLNLETGVSA